MQPSIVSLPLAILFFVVWSSSAAIIGTNSTTLPLTAKRITELPKSKVPAWTDYLARSEKQSRADREFFANEIRSQGVTQITSPPPARGTRGINLQQSTEWYRSGEASQIASNIVSFQTPAGGWSKNLDMTQHRRATGELFAQGNLSRFTTATDLDLPHDPDWNYVGTFDNNATTAQLRFLAKVITAVDEKRGDAFRKSFSQGLDYIFAAQFPNGGWPQVWPLQGGYHDAVTFNDSAMTAILDLLSDVTGAKAEFSFVPIPVCQKAAASLKRGLECVLVTQVVVAGPRTAWSQQYDALTLQPCSARNYEMPAVSSGESAGVMLFLMRLPQPDSNIVAAVEAAAIWLERVAIRDKSYQRVGDDGRHLIASPGRGPIWSRYYEIQTNRPLFGDRDKSIHDTVEEISRERRDGYAWFNDAPKAALERYALWKQKL